VVGCAYLRLCFGVGGWVCELGVGSGCVLLSLRCLVRFIIVGILLLVFMVMLYFLFVCVYGFCCCFCVCVFFDCLF